MNKQNLVFGLLLICNLLFAFQDRSIGETPMIPDLASVPVPQLNRAIYGRVSANNLSRSYKGVGFLQIMLKDFTAAKQQIEANKLKGVPFDWTEHDATYTNIVRNYENSPTVGAKVEPSKAKKFFLNAAEESINNAIPLLIAGAVNPYLAVIIKAAAKEGVSSAKEFLLNTDQESIDNHYALQMFTDPDFQSYVLGQVYDFAQTNPDFANHIDRTYGPFVGASVSLGWEKNIAGSPITEQRLILDNIKKNGDKIEVNLKGLKSAFSEQSKKINQLIEQQRLQMREQILSEAHRKTHQLEREAIENSLNLTCSLIGLGDPNLGHHGQAFARAALGISDQISKLQETIKLESQVNQSLATALSKPDFIFSSANLVGIINFTAGIANIAQGLFALFSNGQDPSMLILEQIRELGKQIREFQTNMNDRFDAVDRSLNEIYYSMDQGFQQLSSKLDSNSLDIGVIKSAVSHIDEHLIQMEDAMYSYMAAGFDRLIKEKKSSCISEDTFDFDRSNFKECLTYLQTYATEHSRDALSVGVVPATFGESLKNKPNLPSFYSSLDEAFFKGTSSAQKDYLQIDIWRNISLLAATLRIRFQDFSLTPSEKNLVNLKIWMDHVIDYKRFLAKHADFIKQDPQAVLTVTNHILSDAEDLRASLAQLSNSKLANKSSALESSSPLILSAIGDYRVVQNNLISQLNRQKQLFETRNTATYDIQGGTDQETKEIPFFSSLPPCASGVKYPTSIPNVKPEILSAPNGDLRPLIPKAALMAEKLGLGSLGMCYDEIDWADKKLIFRDFPGETPHDDGEAQISITVRFEFTFKSGSTVPLSRWWMKNRSQRVFISTVDYTLTKFCLPKLGRLPSNKNTPVCPETPGENEFRKFKQEVFWVCRATHPCPRVDEEIKRNWPNMSNYLVSESTLVATPQDNLKQLESAVSERLKTAREEFSHQFIPNRINEDLNLKQSLKALNGSKTLIRALLSLSYPKTLASNSQLHSFFFNSTNQILDESTIIKLEAQGHSLIPGGTNPATKPNASEITSNDVCDEGALAKKIASQGIFEGNADRLACLEKTLLERKLKSYTQPEEPETQEALENVTHSLRLLKFSINRAFQAKPIDAVLGELRQKLEAYR